MERKTALVTGAGRGIGRAIALKLAMLDYDLVLAARSIEQLEETAHKCRELGASTLSCRTNVADEKQVKNLFEKAINKFGHLDLLVNNAGIGIFKPLTETSLEEWQQILDINLTGAFLCSREAFKIMENNGGGTIINVSSVVGIKGYPNQGAYTASKHGMTGLTKVLAEEGRPHNIRVHVICPGGVATDMVKSSRPDINADELIQPEDIAELVEYFVKMPPRITVDLVHLRRYTSSSF
jgi:3-oxoacyl-[acyl-carrier protein] reductase